jgi:ATP-dependent Clp protease ATP-binding subunit ClpC
MFEKYTEPARRSVFMARYEASQAGSKHIETEHLLAGILATDSVLAVRLLLSPAKVSEVREEVRKRQPPREPGATSVDLPLSKEAKLVLGHAAKEAKRRDHKHIGTEHLLLGISLEEASLGAQILRENQLTPKELGAEADRSTQAGAATVPGLPTPRAATSETLNEVFEKGVKAATEAAARLKAHATGAEPPPTVIRNLSEAARGGALSPLIGREREMDRILRILSRRTRNNPLLVGEPGVGKTAILEGIAQRIADGAVPAILADRTVFAIDASSLVAPSRRARSGESAEGLVGQLTAHPRGILCVDGLLDFAASPGWGAIEATHVLEVLSRTGILCLATGTPAGLRRALDNAGVLVRHFELVEVLPPTEEESVRIVTGLKPQFEKFHGVVFGDGVIEAAVLASGRFLPHRYLPDRALDMIDEAGARGQVRKSDTHEELEIRRRILRIVRDMENAIGNHEFDKAREFSDQERVERQRLQRLKEERQVAEPPVSPITIADLEEALAERYGVPVSAVQEILRQKKGKDLQALAQKLAAVVPPDQVAWLPFLAAYLATCSPEEAERLAQAIRPTP